MGFDNTLFPTDISYGSKAGPGFKTRVIELSGGAEERIAQWSTPRHQYDVGYGIRSYDDLMVVKRFFMARRGALQAFLFLDWQDYTTNATHVLYRSSDVATTGDDQPMQDQDGTAALGFGDSTQVDFQLVKVYEDDIQDYNRAITKPVSGTIEVEVGGASQTEGVDYTINYQTGVVTFTVAPTALQTVRWGGQFYVAVRFDEAIDEWLGMTFDDFSDGTIPQIGMVEDRDGVAVPERFWYGGTKDHGDQTGTTVQINLVDGRVHRISPQDANVTAELQRADDIPSGGPIFFIQNAGSFSMAIETEDAVTVVSGGLSAGGIAEILISDDGAGTKTYIAAT